jgi:hypothetical protein
MHFVVCCSLTKLFPNATQDSPVVNAIPHSPSTEKLTCRLFARYPSSFGVTDRPDVKLEADFSSGAAVFGVLDVGVYVTPLETGDDRLRRNFMIVPYGLMTELEETSGGVEDC